MYIYGNIDANTVQYLYHCAIKLICIQLLLVCAFVCDDNITFLLFRHFQARIIPVSLFFFPYFIVVANLFDKVYD